MLIAPHYDVLRKKVSLFPISRPTFHRIRDGLLIRKLFNFLLTKLCYISDFTDRHSFG